MEDSSSTDKTPSDRFSAPPDWIAVIVLIGSMLVIAITIIAVWKSRAMVLNSDDTAVIRRDIELRPVPRLEREPDPNPDAATVKALDKVAPMRSYSKLTMGDIPPDQSGPQVECVICLEVFTRSSPVRCLKCHHVFHAACIDKWLLAHHRTCPLCMACYVPPEVLPERPPPVRVLPYPELPLRRMAAG